MIKSTCPSKIKTLKARTHQSFWRVVPMEGILKISNQFYNLASNVSWKNGTVYISKFDLVDDGTSPMLLWVLREPRLLLLSIFSQLLLPHELWSHKAKQT